MRRSAVQCQCGTQFVAVLRLLVVEAHLLGRRWRCAELLERLSGRFVLPPLLLQLVAS